MKGLFILNVERKQGVFKKGNSEYPYDNTTLYCLDYDESKGLIPKTFTCKTNDCLLIGVNSYADLVGQEVMLNSESKVYNGVARQVVSQILAIPMEMGGRTLSIKIE